MSKVKPYNYLIIQGWMITELGLSGNELLIYAIIYGFTQGEEGQYFSGSLQYFVDWTNSSRMTVMRSLSALIEKNMIIKKETTISGVKFCEYTVCLIPGVSKWYGGSTKMIPNNNTDNSSKENLNPKGLSQKKERTASSYESILSESGLDETVIPVVWDFIKMRKLIKAPMTDKALSLMISKLKTLNNDPEAQIAILNQSIENSWKGIFPVEHEKRKGNGRTDVAFAIIDSWGDDK